MDFEVFRPDLNQALACSDGSKGGRPPFDPVLMFKILVIQASNNLSDERTDYLINDRLTRAGTIERLFEWFDTTLRNASYLPMSAQILDAALVAAPKQRNTNAEKADLREGRIP